MDGRRHRLQVRPGGDLRDHAAEPGVLVGAGGQRLTEQLGRTVGQPDQSDTGLVAGGLDAHDDGPRAERADGAEPAVHPSSPVGPADGGRRMVNASAPLGW